MKKRWLIVILLLVAAAIVPLIPQLLADGAYGGGKGDPASGGTTIEGRLTEKDEAQENIDFEAEPEDEEVFEDDDDYEGPK
jgi:hypothetical protein